MKKIDRKSDPDKIRKLAGWLAVVFYVLSIAANTYEGNLRVLDLIVMLMMIAAGAGLILRVRLAEKCLLGLAAAGMVYGAGHVILLGWKEWVGLHILLMSLTLYRFARFLRNQEGGPPAAKPSSTFEPPQQHSILLIDDDKSLAKMIKSHLAPHGFVVHHAATGETGLRQVDQVRPDLILLDVILPGIKGREVCQQLKKNPQTAHIPVVFLTAKDSPDDISAELEAGAYSHVSKPVDARKLLEHLKHILSS